MGPCRGTSCGNRHIEASDEKILHRYEKMPTIFIDSVDLLAKTQQKLFMNLLIHAKVLANEGTAALVFVSSEGSILSIIELILGVSRCSRVFEVIDVEDGEGMEYLTKKRFSKDLSQNMLVGGVYT